jgi:hypothetical protein
MPRFHLPANFAEYFDIPNAAERFAEALGIAEKVELAGVPLFGNPDHAAIFCDPPHLAAGPLKRLGYISGWDNRCYPSPVDGEDYINVSARLPAGSPRRAEGWFDYVAVVHPVDPPAREQMFRMGYGNPFLHHVTFGIVPPERAGQSDQQYAGVLVRYMCSVRGAIAAQTGEHPGTLIAALPPGVVPEAEWVEGLAANEYQFEPMDGGGFLLQFFVLTGGRIEVALRVGTAQTFNPRSVKKISRDEISNIQSAEGR